MGNFSFDVNARIKHDKWFDNSPWGSGALAWGGPFLEAAEKLGAKSIAVMAADAEFAQNLCTGARAIAKAKGLQFVYDQNYPPNTVDFSSIIRAVRAAKPDVVFICSYPPESVAIVRAVNELGVGPTVKIIGGGMVGLQFTANMEALGPLLNGFVNYNSWVPEKTMSNPAVREFLKRYELRAKQEKVDQLGFYLPPYAYAMMQVLDQAISATKGIDSGKLAEYIHTHSFDTFVGKVGFAKNGEWAEPRVMMVQYNGIKGNSIDQFREMSTQVIIAPEKYRSGEMIYPYAAAKE